MTHRRLGKPVVIDAGEFPKLNIDVWVTCWSLIQDDYVSTARVKGNVGLGLCWRGLGGAYTFIVRALTHLMTHRRPGKPWLLVIEPHTTTRARVRPANNHENGRISGYKTLLGRKTHGYRLWGIPKAKYRRMSHLLIADWLWRSSLLSYLLTWLLTFPPHRILFLKFYFCFFSRSSSANATSNSERTVKIGPYLPMLL